MWFVIAVTLAVFSSVTWATVRTYERIGFLPAASTAFWLTAAGSQLIVTVAA
jgi:hypothetical protein